MCTLSSAVGGTFVYVVKFDASAWKYWNSNKHKFLFIWYFRTSEMWPTDWQSNKIARMRSSNLLRQETERRTELTFPEPMCPLTRHNHNRHRNRNNSKRDNHNSSNRTNNRTRHNHCSTRNNLYNIRNNSIIYNTWIWLWMSILLYKFDIWQLCGWWTLYGKILWMSIQHCYKLWHSLSKSKL